CGDRSRARRLVPVCPERRDRAVRQARLRPADGRDEQPDQPLLVRAQARRGTLAARLPERVLPDLHRPPRRAEGPGQRAAEGAGPSTGRPGPAGESLPEPTPRDLEPARRDRAAPTPPPGTTPATAART